MKISKPQSQKQRMTTKQIVMILFLGYTYYWLQADTVHYIDQRNLFIKQCIDSGNHVEEHGQHETYVYGCFEGAPSKLIKKFE